MPKQIVAFVISIAIAFIPSLLGMLVEPSGWYDSLDKPPLQPPGWVFGAVWTPLYFAKGVALFLIWRSDADNKRPAYVLFGVQLVLNAAWSLNFFGLELPWVSVAIIVALLAAIILCINRFRPISQWASWLFVTYAAWVVFATYLNIGVAVIN